jgi:hypothetical protein
MARTRGSVNVGSGPAAGSAKTVAAERARGAVRAVSMLPANGALSGGEAENW